MPRTILPGHPAGIGYELGRDGRVRPYELTDKEFMGSIPKRPGRKQRTELFAITMRHKKSVQEILAKERRNGVVAPPPELHALPLIATYMLWRFGNPLEKYLSASTLLLHRKLIRESTAIDVKIPCTCPDE